MDATCASLQGNVTCLLSVLNMTLHVFHILLFADLISVCICLAEMVQQFFTVVGVMLSPCSYRMALGLRGRRSRFEAAGYPPFRVYHGMAAVGYRRTSQ